MIVDLEQTTGVSVLELLLLAGDAALILAALYLAAWPRARRRRR